MCRFAASDKFERDTAFGEPAAQPFELNVDDLFELLFVERVEDDDFVDAIEELGAEVLAQFVEHGRAHHRVVGAVERAAMFENAVAADVRRHDDDRVLEVHGAPLTVGEPPVVENLQEHVEHVRVRLLDFVEENDAIRPAPHRFG